MRCFSLLALLLVPLAVSAAPPPMTEAAKEQVRQLTEQARKLGDQAEQTLKARQTECEHKLVSMDNTCSSEAQAAYRSAMQEAEKLQDQAFDLQPIGDEEAQALKDQIRQLKEKSRTLSEAAEQTFKTSKNACYQKFLVNACIDQAKDEQKASLQAAQALDRQAHALDRELKHRQRNTRDAAIRERLQRDAAEAEGKAAQ